VDPKRVGEAHLYGVDQALCAVGGNRRRSLQAAGEHAPEELRPAGLRLLVPHRQVKQDLVPARTMEAMQAKGVTIGGSLRLMQTRSMPRPEDVPLVVELRAAS